MSRLTYLLLLFASAAYSATVKDPNHYDTIVVGLGASGTAAAGSLARAGRRVLALEAQDRVGGRVFTRKFGDGVVEVGAEWIHGTVDSVTYNLAVQNGVETYVQEIDKPKYWVSDGTEADRAIQDELFKYTWEVTEELNEEYKGPVGVYATRKILEHLRELNSPLLQDEDLLNGTLAMLNRGTAAYEAADNWDEVTTESNYEGLGGEQHQSWGPNGYSTLFDIILNKYKGGPGFDNLVIKLNTEVVKITYTQDAGSPVTVTVKDGGVYTADNVIVTVSVGVLKARHSDLFSPALPEDKVKAIGSIAMGVLDKVQVSWAQPWWEEKSMGFLIWRRAQRDQLDEDSKWISTISSYSYSMGAHNVLSFWLNGNAAKYAETLSDDVTKAHILKLLGIFFKNVQIPEPTGISRTKWWTNPYTLGSYTYDNVDGVSNPTARVDLGRPLLDAAGTPRVLFAGEATNALHFSTVHGAVETGLREAGRILNK